MKNYLIPALIFNKRPMKRIGLSGIDVKIYQQYLIKLPKLFMR